MSGKTIIMACPKCGVSWKKHPVQVIAGSPSPSVEYICEPIRRGN